MKFKANIPTSDASASSLAILSSAKTPKHTIRQIRFAKARPVIPKVLVLVVMLLLVIYAMNEAGKPKNWEWMGFENQKRPATLEPTQVGGLGSASSVSASAARATGSNFISTPANPESSELSSNDSIKAAADLGYLKASMQEAGSSDPRAIQSAELASEFWRSIIGKMKPDQQSTFLKMLRSMRRHEPLQPETRKSCTSLVSIISRNRDQFHQRLFDQLALTPDGTEEKKKLSTKLFDSQAVWEEKILPAFEATTKGEDFTLGQFQAIHQLQSMIDPILFDQVQDKTAIGWAGDAAAWKRIWEIVLGDSGQSLTRPESKPVYKLVTRIELMSQPTFYRGKPIKVEGWVRSARRVEIDSDSELGIKYQYEMWVRPKETKQGPHCIYAHSLPDDFPELSSQFQDLNEHVHIEGYFFKIRTYVATDSSAITSPVIVASGLTRIAPVEYTSVHGWQPSRSTFIALFLLMPILATAIAWWAYRLSQTPPYQPGKKTASKIDKTLEALATDPNVQTNDEKILALYDSELFDSDSDSEAGDEHDFPNEFRTDDVNDEDE